MDQKVELKKGSLFRITDKGEVTPDIWTWDGEHQSFPVEGIVICRVYDGVKRFLPSSTPIVLLEPIEEL